MASRLKRRIPTTRSGIGAASSVATAAGVGVGVTPTLEWTIPDTPYTVPGTWYSQTAGQSYDVSQHVADVANIGVYSITTQTKNSVAGDYGFTVDADTGVISVPADLEDPATTDSYAVSVRLAPAVSAAEADWLARSRAPGVVWAHDFRTANEVNAFRWTGGTGNDPLDLGYPNTCRWIDTDGLTGGCLEIVNYGAAAGRNPAQWWRPFSPLSSPTFGVSDYADNGAMTRLAWSPVQGQNSTAGWTLGNYANADYAAIGSPKDGTDYWIQIRVKQSNTVFQSGVNAKSWYFTRTQVSLTAQELNSVYNNSNAGTLRNFNMYTAGSPGLSGVDPDVYTNGVLTKQYPNPAMASGDFDNIWANEAETIPGPRWEWPAETEWATVLLHVIPGHENDFNNGIITTTPLYPDTGVEVWVANRGATSYTKIWSRSNYRIDFSNAYGYANGWNALLFNLYYGTTVDSLLNTAWQRIGQVIFKKGTGSAFGADPEIYGIPCPQDGL